MVDKTLQVQHQIRANAEEVSSFLSDISKWEKSMKGAKKNPKNKKIITKPPLRQGYGTVPVRITANSASLLNGKETATDSITPSDIVNNTLQTSAETIIHVPKARGHYIAKDPEEEERNRGNQEFKNGNFPAAVKFYTKCLGLKSRNFIAFSNRAMAYIKMKEFHRALNDCDCALSIEPEHVKSLSRRASALNALGRHRAAVRDLTSALTLEPTNKQVRVDLQSSRELLRSAVSRAPMVDLTCRPSSTVVLQGPDLPADRFEPLPEEDEDPYRRDIGPPSTTAAGSPAPPDAVPRQVMDDCRSSSSSTTTSSSSRIAILEDSDAEDDIADADTSTLPASIEQDKSEPPVDDLASTPAATESNTDDIRAIKKKPTKKGTAHPSPPKDFAPQINTVFELQRLLEKALADSSGSAVNSFFNAIEEGSGASAPSSSSSSQSLAPSPARAEKAKKASSSAVDGKKTSKGSGSSSSSSSNPVLQLQRLFGPLMEPDLLLLFLKAVGRRITLQLQVSDWNAVSRSLSWLEWISGSDGCRSFSLLLSLLSSAERQLVRSPLVQLVDGPIDSVRVTSLLAVFKE